MGITSRSMEDALFTRAWVTQKQLHRQKPNPQLQERLKLHSSPLVPLSQTVCFFDLEEGGALWMLFQELSEICSCSVPKEASSTETSWLKKPYWCTVGCWSPDFSVVCNDKQHLRTALVCSDLQLHWMLPHMFKGCFTVQIFQLISFVFKLNVYVSAVRFANLLPHFATSIVNFCLPFSFLADPACPIDTTSVLTGNSVQSYGGVTKYITVPLYK